MRGDRDEKLPTIMMVGLLFVLSVTAPSSTSNEELDLENIDLEELYSRYGITENDLKFAKGELPHYLEGTILDGKVATMGRLVPKEDGFEVLDWENPLLRKMLEERGYTIISYEEWCEIENEAIERYIEKFGVDPRNPKVDIINGVPLPSEYVKEMVMKSILSSEEDTSQTSSEPIGPWAIFSKLYFYIFEAFDSYHRPLQPYLYDTLVALERFYQFGVDEIYYMHITEYWDASDVYPPDDAYEIIWDLDEDTAWLRYAYGILYDGSPANDLVIGWVRYMDHNGIAYKNGFFQRLFDGGSRDGLAT